MANIAVILSGCGYLDGAEIRESVLTLLEIERCGHLYQCFAPDRDQHHVVNHLSGEEEQGTRNVLVESARIARGAVKPLEQLDMHAYDGLIIPGGYGVAKNLSDIAFKGAEGQAVPEMKIILQTALEAKKPIGVICIAPAMLVAALAPKIAAKVTIGDDSDGLISGLGGTHESCLTEGIVVDEAHRIISTSAYMREAPLLEVSEGIAALVRKISDWI